MSSIKRSNADYLYSTKKSPLKSFNELKKENKNHPIRDLMLKQSLSQKDEKYVLIYEQLRNIGKPNLCFIGKNKIDAFIKLYDYLNTERCLCPFDRHAMCLDSFLDQHVFKDKEFDESDVEKFDLSSLSKDLIKTLIDEYCDFEPFDGELIGSSQIM
jgi:hypothetical protein